MKTILVMIAMLFAFAAPAQALEDYEGFAPVQSSIGSGSGDVIGPKVADNKVTSARCMQPQLEAAVLYLNSTVSYADEKSLDTIAAHTGYGMPYEVGWRS